MYSDLAIILEKLFMGPVPNEELMSEMKALGPWFEFFKSSYDADINSIFHPLVIRSSSALAAALGLGTKTLAKRAEANNNSTRSLASYWANAQLSALPENLSYPVALNQWIADQEGDDEIVSLLKKYGFGDKTD